MALKAIIVKDTFDKLPKDVQSEYKANGDKYLLDVEAVDGLELSDVAGLRSALSKVRKEHDDATGKLKIFGDLDPERARKALEQQVDLATMTPNDKVKAQIDATVNQLKDQHRAELEKFAGENKSLYSQLEDSLINAVATQAIHEEKGNVELLLPHVRLSTRVTKDPTSGRLTARVLNPDGTTDRISTKDTSPMSIREFVATDLKKKYPAGFTGSGASGGGADPAGGGGGGGRGAHTISRAEARNPQLFQAKNAAAEKAGVQLEVTD